MTFEGKAKWFLIEKNNLQAVQEWTKSYFELISLYTHTKNSNHLRSHLRDIMALGYGRLGLENKFFENKSGRIFCVWQVYLPTNLGACKPTFYTFYTSHLRWNSTMRRCFYHTDLGQNAVFHNFAIQIALIQYSGRSKHAWAFSETVKKISKITYTASRFSLLTSAKVDCLN